ncbi:hypothetical protein SUGI_1190000 [Cryptomeria japonica]|nr:hypothetical protein SUGI_1190000 [Cryptomeria japonica]
MDDMYRKGCIDGLIEIVFLVIRSAAVGLATYSAISITTLTEHEYIFCSVVALLLFFGLLISSIKSDQDQISAIYDEERSRRQRIIKSQSIIKEIKEEMRRREKNEMALLVRIGHRLFSYKERVEDHFGQSHNSYGDSSDEVRIMINSYGDSSDEVRMMITDLDNMQNELQMSSKLDEFRCYQLQPFHHINEKVRCWMSAYKWEILKLQLQSLNNELWKSCVLFLKHQAEQFPNEFSSDEVQMFGADLETSRYNNLQNQVEILESIIKDLPFISISEHHVDDGGTCPICSEDFVLGEEAIEMPCHPTHIFHSHCIKPWLQEHYTCPNCRMF